MKFKLEIACDNAAFVEGLGEGYEIARILLALASEIEADPILGDGERGTLRDVNGNKVGNWEVSE